jgi:hypothetical protein
MDWVINEKHSVISFGSHIYYCRSSDLKYLTVQLIACNNSLCPVSLQGCTTSSSGSHSGFVGGKLQLLLQKNKIYHSRENKYYKEVNRPTSYIRKVMPQN